MPDMGMPQLVHMLGCMPSRCCKLARFDMPLMRAALQFETHLMLRELQLPLRELPAQMPLHPFGEA